MTDAARKPGEVRTRLPIETEARPRAAAPGFAVFYTLLAVGGAALAAYMALIARHPPMSGYVLAPAFGAAWFGLRAFMSFNRR